MRIRLFHKIFLLAALTAVATALSVAALMTVNLSLGFSDYLDARDKQQLSAFALRSGQALESRGGLSALRNGSLTLGSIMPARSLPRRMTNEQPSGANEGPRPPGRRGLPPAGFEPRLVLFDTDGKLLAGPPAPPHGADRILRQSLVVDDVVVGEVGVLPRGPSPDTIDTQFLQRQFIGGVVLTGLLIALAAGAAFWLARRSTRKFDRMGIATEAIARGDFATRLDIAGRDEIADMAANINIMAESLAKLEAARQRWLAEIGHELRTPMAVLSGELEALRDGVRPMDKHAVNSLMEETERVNLLIEDLHFLAVSDLAEPLYAFGHCDAVQIMQTVANRMNDLLAASGLELSVDLNGLAELPAYWDKARIEQMLANLVENSRRYTNAPGQLKMTVRLSGDSARITVEDTPPGVEEAHLANLFEPLYRLEEARDRASGGSGLGLAICRAIVRGHGGTISACKSDLGGLCICIELPLQTQGEGDAL